MCISFLQSISSLNFKKGGPGYAEEHLWRIQLWEIRLHVSPDRFLEQRSPTGRYLLRSHAAVGSSRCNTTDYSYCESFTVQHAVMSTTWLESYSFPRIFKGLRERPGLLPGLWSFCSMLKALPIHQISATSQPIISISFFLAVYHSSLSKYNASGSLSAELNIWT